ncbi:MAG: ATP-binding protein [Methanomassiliicoccus sp.]|nr:ATP-binding protein [Methanomassiliicoccus sp.]
MKIAVASGKGGTGKTTIAVNLALAIEGDVQLLDCDVEGPNAHLFLRPCIESVRPVGISTPRIDADRCLGCGKCSDACHFNALLRIRKKIKIIQNLCHGCEACQLVCPTGALALEPRRIGSISEGMAGPIPIAFGELDIGQSLSVPVIRELKALVRGHAHTVIDCPPGTSCPVVEAVQGCDRCLMVTEPTPFGLHDLKILAKVLGRMGVPMGAIVNRDNGTYEPLEEFCRSSGIPVLMRIPFDRRIAELYSRGEVLVDTYPGFRERMVGLFNQVRA